MATSLATKRMTRERAAMETENQDYYVCFYDDEILKFDAYVIGPSDTLYQHKFVKLHFEIPPQYPMVPPNVRFIQHSGERIHPNLYVDGKVCLSILGTWKGEPWAYSMSCHSVLITIRSLLDNNPYKHEPGDRDNPAFNKFVEYSRWRCLLFDYLERETVPQSREFLLRYIRNSASSMKAELSRQEIRNQTLRCFTTPYQSPSRIIKPRYAAIRHDLEVAIAKAQVSTCMKRAAGAESITSAQATSHLDLDEPYGGAIGAPAPVVKAEALKRQKISLVPIVIDDDDYNDNGQFNGVTTSSGKDDTTKVHCGGPNSNVEQNIIDLT